MGSILEAEAQELLAKPRSMARFRAAIALFRSLSQPIDPAEGLLLDSSAWVRKTLEVLIDRPKNDDTYTPEEVSEIVNAMEDAFRPLFRGISKDGRIASVFIRAADGSLSYQPRFLFRIVQELQDLHDCLENLPKSLSVVRSDKPVRDGRFEYPKNRTSICELGPDGKVVREYNGFTAPKAWKVVEAMLKASRKNRDEGWVKSEKNWRGAFQTGVYARFKREQLEVGKNRTARQGYWRLRPLADNR